MNQYAKELELFENAVRFAIHEVGRAHFKKTSFFASNRATDDIDALKQAA